jgi:ectoine hydroxylase-related dioxygenase (phytanoyl-CoA dioxygenase family)
VALYDEVWLLPRTPSLRRLVESQLGPGYAQIPAVWCHYVAPVRKTSGWPPHCDGYGRDDRGGRFTLHVPVTEATLENGCMYLVPRDLLPVGVNVGDADTRTVLQASRALPAQPGEVLGWSFDVLHWGSAASGDTEQPRVSLSFELIAADAEPVPDETPLVPMDGLPPFEDRLRFVLLGVLRYAQFEPKLAAYQRLAQDALARLAAG